MGQATGAQPVSAPSYWRADDHDHTTYRETLTMPPLCIICTARRRTDSVGCIAADREGERGRGAREREQHEQQPATQCTLNVQLRRLLLPFADHLFHGCACWVQESSGRGSWWQGPRPKFWISKITSQDAVPNPTHCADAREHPSILQSL